MSERPANAETESEFLPTRRSLLTRLKNWDDQEGWREFFECYWRLIYGVARKAGLSHQEAEDVVQETVVAIAKKMPGFHYDPAIGSFKAWLLLNIRSRIADHLRRVARQRKRIEPLPLPSTGTAPLEKLPDPALPGLEAMWDAEWQQHLLHKALERVKLKVSAKQFLIFDLATAKQTPLRQITRALGVSVAQVYLARHRVGKLLKAEIKKLEKQIEATLPAAGGSR